MNMYLKISLHSNLSVQTIRRTKIPRTSNILTSVRPLFNSNSLRERESRVCLLAAHRFQKQKWGKEEGRKRMKTRENKALKKREGWTRHRHQTSEKQAKTTNPSPSEVKWYNNTISPTKLYSRARFFSHFVNLNRWIQRIRLGRSRNTHSIVW